MDKKGRNPILKSHIIYCNCMRLSEQESLDYLFKQGYKISPRTYYRIKKQLEQSTTERLNLIASTEFLSQHLERLDTLRTIHEELIANYKKETNPTRRSNILMQLAELQQHLAAFYDSTQYILQQSAVIRKKRKQQLEEIST